MPLWDSPYAVSYAKSLEAQKKKKTTPYTGGMGAVQKASAPTAPSVPTVPKVTAPLSTPGYRDAGAVAASSRPTGRISMAPAYSDAGAAVPRVEPAAISPAPSAPSVPRVEVAARAGGGSGRGSAGKPAGEPAALGGKKEDYWGGMSREEFDRQLEETAWLQEVEEKGRGGPVRVSGEGPQKGLGEEKERVFREVDRIAGESSILAAAWLEQMSAYMDRLQEELMVLFRQQGSEIDPATAAALKEIRAEVNRRRQGLMEEMNRRGLLQSGIWLEEENRILEGQMSAEEKLLASRLAEAQKRMAEALLEFARLRLNQMGQAVKNRMEEWDRFWAELVAGVKA